MQLAEGYPIEQELADGLEREKKQIRQWPYSAKLFLTHPGEEREAPRPARCSASRTCSRRSRSSSTPSRARCAAGHGRKEAIYAAYDRFYKGDIAQEFVRGSKEQGGLATMEDLAKWRPRFEEPVSTNYKGIAVYKLDVVDAGPRHARGAEHSRADGPEGHGLQQRALHPRALPGHESRVRRPRLLLRRSGSVRRPSRATGCCPRTTRRRAARGSTGRRTTRTRSPGDPYPFQSGKNPYLDDPRAAGRATRPSRRRAKRAAFEEGFLAGTTSIEAADEEGWVVSVTPSGGWNPVCIAGKTGIGMSQRMQSFVLDPAENPFNVLEPGKRPRVTLTPSTGAQGRQAVPRLRRPGGRHAGPEPAAVLPERRRVRHGRPGGRRGPEHQQLPDAQLVRRPRVEAGPDRDQRRRRRRTCATS